MRVDASEVNYDVQRTYSESVTRSSRVRVDIRREQPQSQTSAPTGQIQDSVDLTDTDDARTMMVRMLIERLLGGKFDRRTGSLRSNGARSAPAASSPAAQPSAPQWSVSVSSREVYRERESLAVKATGSVTTSDGQQISFNAKFQLSRSFEAEVSSLATAGNAKLSDPLFLDTGTSNALLVHDADGNNQLTDSTETFGAASGNGFGELAAYDSDQNGWIDEGDPVFATLKLQLGDGSLSALESLGIGAISTQSAAGEFQYKDSSNQLTAIVRRTGIYLTESGRVGAVRQIDLASETPA